MGGRGRQRILSSDRRPRRDQLRDRWPAHQRPAEQAVFHADSAERAAEHGVDHRHARRPVWRQDQPGGQRDDAVRARRHQAVSAASNPLGGRSERGPEQRRLGFGTPTFGNFITLNGTRSGRFLDTPELSAHPRHRQQWEHIRPRGLAARPPGHFPFGSVRRAKLVSGSEQLRSVGAGSEAARDELEHRARLPAHLQRPHLAHGESLRAPRSAELLPQPRSFQRYPGDGSSQNRFLTNLRQSRPTWRITHGQPRHQSRYADPADAAARRISGSVLPIQRTIRCAWMRQGIRCCCPDVTDPSACGSVNPSYVANPSLLPGIVPYDLTRGGSLFNFHGTHNINQYAFYIQDTITLGKLTIDAGFPRRSVQRPRLRRTAFSRAGLVVSGAHQYGAARILRAHVRNAVQREPDPVERNGRRWPGRKRVRLGSRLPIEPGNRNDFDTGLQQGVGTAGSSSTRITSGSTRTMPTISRAVQYAHHVSDLVAQFQSGWCDGARQHRQFAWVSSLPHARPHAGAYSSARSRRVDSV